MTGGRAHRSRWLLCGALALAACVRPPPPTPMQNVQVSNEVFTEQLRLAREALGRQEWNTARENLAGLVEALPATDATGAEARASLARVAFELGDYAAASAAGEQVPEASPHGVTAREYGGLARLFSCEFDQATETFFKLVQQDAPRGRVWLGVSYAWTGAEGNAERELNTVVREHASSEHGPNARFYLAQLALWGRHRREARQQLDALNALDPNYLTTLDQRAQNWLSRGTHLMRAYFTFDTLARLAELTGSPNILAHDRNADAALQALQRAPGACQAQVGRLAAARQAHAAERGAVAAQVRDADGDGIPDARDRCPNEAETVNAVQDTDGCPEQSSAIAIEGNQIQVRQGYSFSFDAGSDRMNDSSRPVLEAIVAVLTSPDYAWIRRIRLEGHTDDVGEASANMDLSRRRVVAIGAALVGRGVPRDKIDVASFGESRPIDPTGTDDARARNRRVEIFITDPPMFGGVRANQ